MEEFQTISEATAYYRCRVNIRPTYRGCRAKESILALNGFEVTLQCDDLHTSDDAYPDEVIFTPCTDQIRQLFFTHGLQYLAEGDITILEQIMSISGRC
jgi:hypothetical protein